MTTNSLNLALDLKKRGDLANALRHVQQAIHEDANFGPAWLELADLALKLKAWPLAAMAGERAVELLRDDLAALIAYGLALDMNSREDEALTCFEKAVALKPDFAEAWSMLGLTSQNLLRLDDAEHAFRKARDLAATQNPNAPHSAHQWNLGILELLRGNLPEGFDLYRVRYNSDGWLKRLQFPQPVWQGEDVKGKKLFIAGEQGFGDVLMLARYLPLLKDRGANVMLMADAALIPYFQQWYGIDRMINTELLAQEDFDYQIGLFDLPYYFKTTLATIPANRYLPQPAPDEKTKLPDDGKMRIGIVYAGRRAHGNDRRRSLPLSGFAPLFDTPNTTFYNFTHDASGEDKEILKAQYVTDLAPQITDFRISAQYVGQMDLVITCDTSMAHLAGGMGKKTWLLLPFAPEWRWLTGRNDSPWYPAMKLFRQRVKGDWDDVIRRVCSELQQLKS